MNWIRGVKIDADGVYPMIPLDDYHGDLCVGHSTSHTGLNRVFNKSPLHYYDKSYINPAPDEDDPTEVMILGRAAHHLFLGERDFQKHFVRRPEEAPDGRVWNGNNLSCKAWLDKQERAGLIVITPTQVEALAGMKAALAREPLIQAGALSGRVETSLIWRDEETGIWLKARPDAIPNDTGDFADLKIVSDISDDGIERTIGDMGYHRQGALVLEGAARLLKLPPESLSFTLFFVESKRPHCVQIVTLKPSDLDAGAKENRAALRLLKRCLETNEWPGPAGSTTDARYIGLKKWTIDANTHRLNQIRSMLELHPPKITP